MKINRFDSHMYTTIKGCLSRAKSSDMLIKSGVFPDLEKWLLIVVSTEEVSSSYAKGSNTVLMLNASGVDRTRCALQCVAWDASVKK